MGKLDDLRQNPSVQGVLPDCMVIAVNSQQRRSESTELALLTFPILAPLANANKFSDFPDFNDAAKLGGGKEKVGGGYTCDTGEEAENAYTGIRRPVNLLLDEARSHRDARKRVPLKRSGSPP